MLDPLTPEQIASIKADGVPGNMNWDVVDRLIVTVEQAWAERDGQQARLDTAYDWPEQHPQRQDSVTDQLTDLHRIAARLGMYDAADWLWKRMPEADAITRARDTAGGDDA